jgi:hypothetical protein
MLVDEYKKYVFEMEEQGMQPISFKEFIQQAMQGMAYGGSAKPTYTQSRKQQLAYGGIAGADGRKRYGIGSWFQEYIKDPIEKAVRGLPDEYYPEGHPQAGQKKPAHEHSVIKGESQARVDRETAATGDPNYKPWYEQIFSPDVQQLTQDTASNLGLGDLAQNIGLGDLTRIFGQPNQETGSIPFGMNWANLPEGLRPYLQKMTKAGVEGTPRKPIYGPDTGGVHPPQIIGYEEAQQAIPPEYAYQVNPVYPISMGLAAGEYARRNPGPTLPEDTARDASRIDLASAIKGDDLRFKLDPSLVKAAQGGRIGYDIGGDVSDRAEMYYKYIQEMKSMGVEPVSVEEFNKMLDAMRKKGAQGGRIGAQEGGLMDLGGMEKDYRNEGGFVPIGGQERADDVPARLSKNEFVFTADAVRSAGGGDIDKGAEVMENVMNNLEQGGQISQESQGLEGARNMFATAQRLEGVM